MNITTLWRTFGVCLRNQSNSLQFMLIHLLNLFTKIQIIRKLTQIHCTGV